MKITSVPPIFPMKIKQDGTWFLVLAINAYFDDSVFDAEEDGNIKYTTYTTHYGEIGLMGLPELYVYIDNQWVFEQDFV